MTRLPFFIVTGASGSGKTFVIPEVRKLIQSFDIFDIDLMKGNDWQLKKTNWFRIAYSISESGRGTVLFGTIVPKDVEKCDYRDRFSAIHIANLHCQESIRRDRLMARKWELEKIQRHIDLGRWFWDNKDTAFDTPMSVIDSSDSSPALVARQIASWVMDHWRKRPI